MLRVVAPEPPPAVRRLAPQVPPELERICLKCLSKKPADRYPSARALAGELRRCRARLRRPAALPCLPAVTLEVIPSGRRVPLTGLRNLLDSAAGCGVLLPAAGVEPQHCRVLVRPGQAILEDLGSRGGTFVNDRRIRRVVLRTGDVVKLGPYTFRVRLA